MHRRIALSAFLLALALSGCEQKHATPPSGPETTKTASVAAAPDRPVNNPYPTATHVRLFVERDYDHDGKPILGKTAGSVLSAAQRRNFETALVLITPPDEVAGCFIPHHFFRYFDKRGKQVGEIAVCFCCYGIEATGEGNFQAGPGQILAADYAKLKALVRALGEPADVQC